MEDPIRFEVWGKVIPEQRDNALAILRAQSIFSSELELRKAANKAAYFNTALRISSSLGYGKAQKFAAAIRGIFEGLTFCQEGWLLDKTPHFCEKHNFHFAGCLGCHV